MRVKRAPRPKLMPLCIKEARRFYHLTQLRDALNRLGTLMYRGSLKYTLIMSIATGLGHQLPKIGLPGLNAILAIVLPVLVFVLAFGGGLCLRYIPSLISLGHITSAEAADFNLMKDYRKGELDEHLDILWERVFRYEADIRYTKDAIDAEENTHRSCIPRIRTVVENMEGDILQYLGAGQNKSANARKKAFDDMVEALLSARPQCAHLEKTKRAFLSSARHAIREHLEQEEQTRRIGFDLSQWEDWRDSAYFHTNDRRLAQQFSGNPVLQAAKRETNWGYPEELNHMARRSWQKLWFRLFTRAISVHLGTALTELNEDYPVEQVGRRFKAQLIMWPGAERDAAWLDELQVCEPQRGWLARGIRNFFLRNPDLPSPAARLWEQVASTVTSRGQHGFETVREEIVARRLNLIKSRFGRTFRDAEEIIDRIYLPTFELATELRIAYDAEYAAGLLEQTPAADYKRLGFSAEQVSDIQDRTDRVRRELASFLDHAREAVPTLSDDRESRRAVAVAYHTNRNDWKSHYSPDEPVNQDFRDRIADAVARRKRASHYLQEVRMHQSLTLMQVLGARRYIRRLAYPNAESA